MSNSISKEQIVAIEAKLAQAMQNADLAALDALLHDDLQFVTPDGKVATKATDLQNYTSGEMKVYEVIPQIENISLIKDTAVVTLVSKMKGAYFSQHFEGSFRYLRVWQKQDGYLKVIAGSVMQLEL